MAEPTILGEVYQVMAEIGLQHVERLLAEDCPDRERRLAQRDALLALLGRSTFTLKNADDLEARWTAK